MESNICLFLLGQEAVDHHSLGFELMVITDKEMVRLGMVG